MHVCPSDSCRSNVSAAISRTLHIWLCFVEIELRATGRQEVQVVKAENKNELLDLLARNKERFRDLQHNDVSRLPLLQAAKNCVCPAPTLQVK